MTDKLEEQAKEPFSVKASPKTLTQIEVCTLTRSAVNCGKGMEYCKVCGAQDTTLLSLESAQKLQEELADMTDARNELFTSEQKYQTKSSKLEAKLAEANKIVSEDIGLVIIEDDNGNQYPMNVYPKEDIDKIFERLRGVLSTEAQQP